MILHICITETPLLNLSWLQCKSDGLSLKLWLKHITSACPYHICYEMSKMLDIPSQYSRKRMKLCVFIKLVVIHPLTSYIYAIFLEESINSDIVSLCSVSMSYSRLCVHICNCWGFDIQLFCLLDD